MTRHAWAYAYRDALGPRMRCERCGMLSTWVGASYPCTVRESGDDRARKTAIAQLRKAARREERARIRREWLASRDAQAAAVAMVDELLRREE